MFHDPRPNGDRGPSSEEFTTFSEVRPFKLTELVVEDGCREIEIEGELDLSVVDRLQQALAACPDDHVLIDLRSCQLIDSTGIALIVDANRQRQGNSRVLLHSPCDQVLRVLEITGLASNGFVFADRERALSAIGRSGD